MLYLLSPVPAAQWNHQWLGTNLPSEAPTLCCPPCPLWMCSGMCMQHSPHHRQGIYLQREWLHSQQPLPWSCSSHRNYRNCPHIIFPSGLMCFTLSALDGNTEMQSSPLVLPGEPRPETPEHGAAEQAWQEHCVSPRNSGAEHGKHKRKSTTSTNTPLVESREGNALLSSPNRKKGVYT